MSLFPNTPANALDGPVRILRAPTSVAVPTRISDVIDVIGPAYAPKTDWIDFGGTSDGDETEIDRDMESEDYRFDQSNVAILEKITEVNRTMKLPVAEITPENMKVIEEGQAIATLATVPGATVTGKGAEKVFDIGAFESLTRYRIAIIAMRDPGFGGIVTEAGNANATRGPFVGWFGYQAALAAEGSSMGVKKGELASREVTFAFFPDSSIADPKKAIGRFAFETAPQTIATS